MITLHLTPAEHAFLLLKLGRGTGSTIRPGESLSAEEVLRLTDKVEGAEVDVYDRAPILIETLVEVARSLEDAELILKLSDEVGCSGWFSASREIAATAYHATT